MLFDTLYPLYVIQVSIYYKLVTNLRADVGVTFNYIPDYDVRMRAVEWFGYGLHPSEAQKIAELGRSVDDVVRGLARAKAEREDLEWEGLKLTNEDIGKWAADFGGSVARLRHLTDAHLAQALAEEEAPQNAIFASID